MSNFATKTALTSVENKIPDVSNLVKKGTMTQKLKKLKANMLVILDLTQNQHKRMLLQKEILMQKSLNLKIILKSYKHLIQAILEVKAILMKMAHKIIQCFYQYLDILK